MSLKILSYIFLYFVFLSFYILSFIFLSFFLVLDAEVAVTHSVKSYQKHTIFIGAFRLDAAFFLCLKTLTYCNSDPVLLCRRQAKKPGFGVVGSGEGCANRGDKVDPAQFDAANKKW